jgi:hypothetical protein
MRALQIRHRPRKTRYETKGTLSKALMEAPQSGHLDDGHTIAILRGVQETSHHEAEKLDQGGDHPPPPLTEESAATSPPSSTTALRPTLEFCPKTALAPT